jgi:CRP/FNR family transcriptional regulator, cyclic AMP receptor protein
MSLSRYVKGCPAQTFTAGDTIFKQGDEGRVMYVVLSGDVELTHETSDVIRVGPGESFGEMALIEHRTRSATAVAASDVELASINQATFLVLVQGTPYFALEVMRSLSERLRRANDREANAG